MCIIYEGWMFVGVLAMCENHLPSLLSTLASALAQPACSDLDGHLGGTLIYENLSLSASFRLISASRLRYGDYRNRKRRPSPCPSRKPTETSGRGCDLYSAASCRHLSDPVAATIARGQVQNLARHAAVFPFPINHFDVFRLCGRNDAGFGRQLLQVHKNVRISELFFSILFILL